ncbi:MAG TPA: hypothetical protein VJ781_03925 [Pyrinomonadaceae bacterium]|jgi:hypothetical protein|nr:hypothetical protein [Pyrinomonadaceae bacterium]
MKTHLTCFVAIVCVLSLAGEVYAQRKKALIKPAATRNKEIGQTAIVLDETLSVLRPSPSLFAEPVQRMRRGREVKILGVAEADGVKFFKVTAAPRNFGWVQSDAVFGKFRPADEERLARLVQASNGFEQLELAAFYFTLYPNSQFRPPILLLFGDLCQETAVRLSREATNRLDRREMAASAAPLHSYYLNYVGLDRYRKLGITFKFNTATRTYYYDGRSWLELVSKFASSPEAVEAQKRLDAMRIQTDSAGQK